MTRPEPTRSRLRRSQADHPHDLSDVEGVEDLVVLTLPYCKCHRGDDLVLARRVGEDTYRIVEIPPKPASIGLGDLVIALPFGDLLDFIVVLERRCHASCHFTVPEWADPKQFLALLDRTGVAHREIAPGSYIINADSVSALVELGDLLKDFDISTRCFDHDTQDWTDL